MLADLMVAVQVIHLSDIPAGGRAGQPEDPAGVGTASDRRAFKPGLRT